MATFLPAVLRGGVDVVQLREKNLGLEVQRETGALMKTICADYGVPFIINDSPELAADLRADGVHVGQDDVAVSHCRALLGDEAIIGLSTHETAEFTGGLLQEVSYLSAGPIEATPTKPGREGTGISYAVESQARSRVPVFVTGGVDAQNVGGLVAAGLRHFVVVRALTEASDPFAAATAIRRAIDESLSAVPVEPAQ
jgi:thiamine-phosphate pyrophosphorylase